MTALPLVLMLIALIFTGIEAVRARSLGWAGAAAFVLAIIIGSGAFRITDG